MLIAELVRGVHAMLEELDEQIPHRLFEIGAGTAPDARDPPAPGVRDEAQRVLPTLVVRPPTCHERGT